LVEPQSKTKATRRGDPDPGALVEAEYWHYLASTRHHAKAKKAVGSSPHFSQAAAKSSSSSADAIP
jgi:hypothetical protein